MRLAAGLGLDIAGIDLKLRTDGSAVCFEVNPSPAYSTFEEAASLPISGALATYLGASDVTGTST